MNNDFATTTLFQYAIIPVSTWESSFKNHVDTPFKLFAEAVINGKIRTLLHEYDNDDEVVDSFNKFRLKRFINEVQSTMRTNEMEDAVILLQYCSLINAPDHKRIDTQGPIPVRVSISTHFHEISYPFISKKEQIND